MNGNNILIYLGGSVIAATKSHKVRTEAKTIEKSSPASATWEEYLTRRKNWTLTVNYLVLTTEDIIDLLKVGNTYSLMVKGRGNNVTEIAGNAILNVCEQTYTRGRLVEGVFQFQGTGGFAIV